ncbi:hypothetical protein BHM03_00024744 [Ensete ventricosum]|nr:hypothetical protein BHM03_00024744 [Ensete ventricosum]
MVEHNILFKHQVRELHRLYWTQKKMMNEACWRRSDLVSAPEARGGSKLLGEEKTGDVRSRWLTVRYAVAKPWWASRGVLCLFYC